MTEIRLAGPDDLPLLVRHRRGMFEDFGRDYTQAQLDQQDRDYASWASARLATGEFVGFIAESLGRAVASGCLWLRERQPAPGLQVARIPYLLSMFTERDCRRQGHAELIVHAALRWASDHGYPRLNLHASEMGRGLYEKLKFNRMWEMEVAIPPAPVAAGLKDPA